MIQVDLTGDYGTTIYDEARRLLAEGHAPDDVVVTSRNGQESMSGVIGQLAKSAVSDGNVSGLRLVRWRPFSMSEAAE